MNIIIKKGKDNRYKYFCPHCNAILTSTLRNTTCRKCGKPVNWKNIPK